MKMRSEKLVRHTDSRLNFVVQFCVHTLTAGGIININFEVGFHSLERLGFGSLFAHSWMGVGFN